MGSILDLDSTDRSYFNLLDFTVIYASGGGRLYIAGKFPAKRNDRDTCVPADVRGTRTVEAYSP